MITRMLVRALSLLILNFLASLSLWACSCYQLGMSRCQALGQHDVIFVGTVLEIDEGGTGPIRYHFHVDENFKGTSGSAADVYSGRGGGDCSFHFLQATQYLVITSQDKPGDQPYVTACSGTRLAEQAKALILQLRAMRDHTRVASLYGEFRRTQQPYTDTWQDSAEQSLANTLLRAQSGSRVFETKTDSDGNYAFYGLPAGSYRFTALMPEGLEIAQIMSNDPLPPLNLPAGACFEYNIYALPTGRIRGRVLAPDGKPLPDASVELFALQKYKGEEWSGFSVSQKRDHPYFEFLHIAPGDYLVVFNNRNRLNPDAPFPRTFYSSSFEPPRAQVIHLMPAEQFLTADIHLTQGRPTRTLTVVLKGEQKPSRNEYFAVYVEGSEGREPATEEVGPGVYSINLLREAHYTLEGRGFCEDKCNGQGCSPSKKWKTPAVEVDGSDDRTPEVALLIPANRCTQ